MTIKMLVKNGDITPTVFCDVCGDPIEDYARGMFAWMPTNEQEGEVTDVVFCHKGRCDSANCQRTSTDDQDWCWQELCALPLDVLINSGVPRKEFIKRVVQQEFD